MADYQISVVTPFHNVKMDVFRRAHEAMLQQTIGFANIEWIIVLHNTEEEYHAAMHELLDRYPNVILERLDNDAHTPSSPRNHGMKLATAPCLGFLDGDDSYTPICLEKCVQHIRDSGSQMVIFRREFEMENEHLAPITEIVLWDQTREEIIVDRENWDDEKMFTGIWGMVTSRIFDRKFLMDNAITFNEEVPFLEDNLFLIEAYGKVRQVSYLPQLIGYHYFIHEGSLVQGMSGQSGATLIRYAEGFRIIFDTALRNGIYAEWTIGFTLAYYARSLVQATGLTLEDRQKIKEILEPYVHMIPMLPVNKITSEKDAKIFYEVPRAVLLHPENFDKGASLQSLWNGEGDLLEIIQENQDTDYGKHYRFDIIRTAAGYQSRVPLSHYDTYLPLIELQTKVGESGILTSAPVYCYLMATDNSGAPRLFPATRKHLEPYFKAFCKIVSGKTTFLMAESLPMQGRYNDQKPLNTLTGILLSEFFQQERNDLRRRQAKFTAPEALLFPPGAMDTLYLRILFAIRERNVEQIVSPFTQGIVEAFSFLERHWQVLTDDIAEGRITMPDLTPEFMQRIERYVSKDPERAEELRAVFRDGFDKPVAPRIWPKLRRVVANGVAGYRIYADRMKHYTGDTAHSHWNLALSAALVGRTVEGTDYFELDTGSDFYEFLPLGAEEGTMPFLLSQVKAGCDYELIVTSRAGLYRFCTGAVIRVRECKNGKLVFSYLGNKKNAVRIGEAVLREGEIYGAIHEASAGEGLAVVDYAVYAEAGEKGGRLEILLEAEESSRSDAAVPHDRSERFAAALDAALRRGSAPYDAARQQGTLPCSIAWLQPQTALLYRDVLRFRYHTAPDHIKPIHFLDTPAKIKFFRKMLLEE